MTLPEQEANVGEHLTTEEIEKVLFRRYQYEGKVWTALSYLECDSGVIHEQG